MSTEESDPADKISDSIDLLCCPFCGGKAVMQYTNMIYCEETVNCGAQILSGESGSKTSYYTVAAWIRRHNSLCRHPTLAECEAAGHSPAYKDCEYSEGGLPDTPEERERFETYMTGKGWYFGGFDTKKHWYDSISIRQLYHVWRDRGALPTIWS